MRQFSPPHLAALAVAVIGIGLVANLPRRRPGPWTRWLRWALALAILGFWAGEYVADAFEGIWSVQFTLPLQLTDAVSLTAAIALITEAQWAVEFLYFWAFTATLQAVVTPDLGYDFPNFFYFTYFGYHVGAMLAAVLLVFGLGHRPRRSAMWRTLAATLAWAALAGSADVITGGNYMYLAWKPTHGSLLSVMGPWPWYIAAGIGVAAVMLGLVELITRPLLTRIDARAAVSSADR